MILSSASEHKYLFAQQVDGDFVHMSFQNCATPTQTTERLGVVSMKLFRSDAVKLRDNLTRCIERLEKQELAR